MPKLTRVLSVFFAPLLVSQFFSVALTSCAHRPAPARSSGTESVKQPGAVPGAQGGLAQAAEPHFMPVAGQRGMVVSDDPDASAWGAEILRRGGNAVDAAVGTAFYMAVSRPQYASLGGGGFLLYCPAPVAQRKSQCRVVDFRETAGAAATPEFYRPAGKANVALSQDGATASGVPGVVAGWTRVRDQYGSKPLRELLSRPIERARQGVVVSYNTEATATERWKEFNAEAKRIFGCGHESRGPCAAGDVLKQPDLARLMEQIAARGRAAFYEGAGAQKIVQGLRTSGGQLSADDFAKYEAVERKPLSFNYGPLEVVSMPPPSSGGAVLAELFAYAQMADATHAFEQGPHSVEALHALAHGMSLAYRDRAQDFGDPAFVKVPLEKLLAPARLKDLWTQTYRAGARNPVAPEAVDSAAAKGAGPTEHVNTTHFVVVDARGNAVSVTTTVNGPFGSGFVPPGTGVVMNNEMDDFSLQPGVPNMYGLVGSAANAIAPNKRPLSSMTPTIVRDGASGEVRIVIGAQGGPRISTAVFQTLWLRMRFGWPLNDAISAPRIHEQWRPEKLFIEKWGFAPALQKQFVDRGYTLEPVSISGRAQAIERTAQGRVFGAPDPRSEAGAVAE